MIQQSILISGMGVSGKSASKFLDAQCVAHSCCDDLLSEYGSCSDVMPEDYILKSPGIPGSGFEDHDHHKLLNDIELFLRLTNKPVVMVTGTNGKSTVVALLEHILNSCGIHAIACGNNGVPVLHALESNASLYVVELSSYQAENLSCHRSAVSVVLNISEDHLSRYKDMHEYLSIKQAIYKYASASVYPQDADNNRNYAGEITGYHLEQDGFEYSWFITDQGIQSSRGDVIAHEDVNVRGRHNALNICASLCICRALGLDIDQIKKALPSFAGLAHRLEVVCNDDRGRQWVNDSKSTNLHSVRAAVDAYHPVTLIMGGQGKGEDYADLFAEISTYVESLICMGQEGPKIYQAAQDIQTKHLCEDVEQAISQASGLTGDNGIVLFSPGCASFDQYKDFIQRGERFSSVVREKLPC